MPLLRLVFGPPRARRAVAQFGRAPVSKTGGWGFESLLPCCHDQPNSEIARTEAVT
jgi:hypothetical protein